jgi:xylulokinase
MPIRLPAPAEYVALGAARQAASALRGEQVSWDLKGTVTLTGDADKKTREQYQIVSQKYISNFSS